MLRRKLARQDCAQRQLMWVLPLCRGWAARVVAGNEAGLPVAANAVPVA